LEAGRWREDGEREDRRLEGRWWEEAGGRMEGEWRGGTVS